jgi:hypothetical protein
MNYKIQCFKDQLHLHHHHPDGGDGAALKNNGFYNSYDLAVCPRRLYREQSMVKVFSVIRILYLKTMHLQQICQNNT